MKEKILTAIKELREKSKKRNFSQTLDIIINLKEFDTKKPENRFSEDVILPNGRGKDAEIIFFSDSIKDVDCKILRTEDLTDLAKNKRNAKKLIGNTDFFLAEAKLMPVIGKMLGIYLGPRGKMPKIITGDVKIMVKNYKKSIRIKVKDSPVIQCLVGNEEMEDEKLAENIESVLDFLKTKLPKGKHNIAKLFLKFTMSKPVEIEV